MTDRVNSLLVIMDKDYRDDDMESTIAALMHIKHVIKVVPNVCTPLDHVAEARESKKWRDKLIKLLQDD